MCCSIRGVRLVCPALIASLALCLLPESVHAEDECSTDAECVELYTDGFTCVQGTLGRYCLEPGCEGPDCYDWSDPCEWEECGVWSECEIDEDCLEMYGESWVCLAEGDSAGQCAMHECETDLDCEDRGPAWECVSRWDESWCEEDPGYVPRFRSCAAAPGRAPAGAWLVLFVVAVVLARRRP